MKKLIHCSTLFAALLFFPLPGTGAEWQTAADPELWAGSSGAEYPGGSCRMEANGETLLYHYDFSRGGAYFTVATTEPFPADLESIQLRFGADEPLLLSTRVIDSRGYVFQTAPQTLGPGEKLIYRPDLSQWPECWNGARPGDLPQRPWRQTLFTVKPRQNRSSGVMRAYAIDLPQYASDQLATRPARDTISYENWELEINWEPTLRGGVFLLSATPRQGAQPVNLELAMPMIGRNQVYRILLTEKKQFRRLCTLPRGGNPYNRYWATVKLGSENAGYLEKSFPIAGIRSDAVNLGEARPTSEIPESIFGVCTHFSFGHQPGGRYGGWHYYRELLDLAAAAGFKWIREECNILKDADGNYAVSPRDLEWIRYAHEKGIHYILMIPMLEADQPMEEFLRKVEAAVRDTRQWVRVYELGNEPQHAGSWLRIHGGTWNGKESDNSTSPWVKAHLRYTNAAARKIKECAPDATVIGLGMAAPTNFRALELGVDHAVDGVVDHAYTYCLPPERIPFGTPFTGRDGIAVGDAEFSFAGMVNSYREQFQKTGRERELWITEFGFSTYLFTPEATRSVTMLYAGYSEEAQATYLARRFLESLTLPVAALCVYDLLDDFNSQPFEAEANFGLLRGDRSPKPAYHTLARVNSLFSGTKPDRSISVTDLDAPLHRAARRHTLVANWDHAPITADNSLRIAAFQSPSAPEEKLLAVWSAQPFTTEFNVRPVRFTLHGAGGYDHLVMIDLVTGVSCDLPWSGSSEEKKIDLPLPPHPVAVKLFR